MAKGARGWTREFFIFRFSSNALFIIFRHAPHGEAGLRFSGNRGLFMLGVSQNGRSSFHLVELLRKFVKSGVKIRAREHRFGLAANPGHSGT